MNMIFYSKRNNWQVKLLRNSIVCKNLHCSWEEEDILFNYSNYLYLKVRQIFTITKFENPKISSNCYYFCFLNSRMWSIRRCPFIFAGLSFYFVVRTTHLVPNDGWLILIIPIQHLCKIYKNSTDNFSVFIVVEKLICKTLRQP